MKDFKWIGSKVDCYEDNPLLQKGCFEFYTSFFYNGEEFRVGEFALFKQNKNNEADSIRVGRLKCVFHSHEDNIKYNGIVHWYTWARNLPHKLKPFPTKFDEKNEVVEEMTSSESRVSLKDIKKKCIVVCATLAEPAYLIKEYNLNPDVFFSCRYTIEHNQLLPYFSKESIKNADNEDYIVRSELNKLNGQLNQKSGIIDVIDDSEFSNMKKLHSTKDHEKNSTVITDSSPFTKTTPMKTSSIKLVAYNKRKSCHTANLDSEGSDVEEKYVNKVRSPSNSSKILKLTPNSNKKILNGFLSPLKRNLTVKRVLNDSFDDSPNFPSGTPTPTYSIIDAKLNDPKQIKIKFKLTEKQTGANFRVFPTKLDDEIVQMKSPIKINDLLKIKNRVEFSPDAKAKMSEAKYNIDSPHRSRSSAQVGSPYTPAQISLTRRRSSRTIERKSYAEYHSPEENTPKKRVRRTSTDSHHSFTVKTPFKTDITSLSKIDEDEGLNDVEKPKIEVKRQKQDSVDHENDSNMETYTAATNNNETNIKTSKHNGGQRKKHSSQINGDCNKNLHRLTPKSQRTTECSKKEIDNKDSGDSSSSNENDAPTKTNSKVGITIAKHKILERLTNELKKDVQSDTNDKLLITTPRSKRNAGTPKRYINIDNSNKTENSTPVPKHKEGSSTKSNDNDNCAKSSRQTRSVGRPKKYIDSDSDDMSNRRSSKLIRSVGCPRKYISGDESDYTNNKRKINNEKSSKLIGNVSISRKYTNSDSESTTNVKSPRKKRSVRRHRKYSESDKSDDSDSDNHTSNKKNKLQIKNNFKTPTKTPYSTTKKPADNFRRSVRKNSRKKLDYTESDEDDLEPRTPKTQRQRSIATTPKSIVKYTPTARARMIREGIIIPSVQVRNKAVVKDNTPLSKARTQLHVSFVPKSLPCREKEFADIINFLEGKLLDGCGGCMYVSGVPGTGKTATVTEVIRSLQKSVENGDFPSFKYVNVNGMRLSEPRQSYVEIVRQLMGKTVHWEQAQTMLENRFAKSQKKSAPIILVVDELDILCTKRQDVVYNLLDWPTKANAQLIVITIANTMDLPERLLMGRVTSRLGLTRLTFQAYTHKQLQEIVSKRLSGISAFNPDAIQLVARKVASVSGDARRALDICRRAVEIAELEGKDALVSMIHVNQALNAMITQPKVQAIKRCSRLEKLILQAVVAEVERTGVEETNFASVLTMLVSIAALDGFQMVSSTIAMAAVSKLGACRLLLTDQKHNNIYQRIILNVSADDVYYALTKTDI